jgi:spore germination cell wall hydrolase CwlJ-like protein
VSPAQLSELAALMLTIYGEARAETPDGQIAVAQVVMHRLRRGRWGHTIQAVVGAKAQFSCWWKFGGLQNWERVQAMARTVLAGTVAPELRQACWIAEGVFGERVTRDLVRGATHYLTADLLRSGHAPAWTRGMTITAHIGGHVFGRPAGE